MLLLLLPALLVVVAAVVAVVEVVDDVDVDLDAHDDDRAGWSVAVVVLLNKALL